MDGSTGEEIKSYRDSHGDMPTFGTVDEAVDYCHRNGIDFENAAEVDQWHTIEIERAKAVPDGQVQKDGTEKPLTADDIQNLVLTNREYFAGSRTTVYDFECDIRGEHDTLQYTLEYHDDREGFTIHTEKDDIWERMPEPELERLEGILSREAVYFKYHEKIAGAESLEALKELEYEIMEDESPYFSAVSERVWNDFTRKEEMLSGKTQETSGHDVQKSAQEEKTSERPETGERAANAPIPYPVENARHDYTMGSGGLRAAAAMADKPAQRASLKEKLAAYKAQVSGADRADTDKAKRKEETL